MLRISCRCLILSLVFLLAAMSQPPKETAPGSWEEIEQTANAVLKQIREGRLVGESKTATMMELLQANRQYLAANPSNEKAWLMSANLCGELGDEECLDASALADSPIPGRLPLHQRLRALRERHGHLQVLGGPQVHVVPGDSARVENAATEI